MYIGYNKYQRYGKIFFIVFYIFIGWVLILRLPPNAFPTDTFMILLVIFILLGSIFMLMQLIFLPSGVEINNDDKTLTVYYFLIKPNIIRAEDILDYSTTKICTKSTDYEGVLVHTK